MIADGSGHGETGLVFLLVPDSHRSHVVVRLLDSPSMLENPVFLFINVAVVVYRGFYRDFNVLSELFVSLKIKLGLTTSKQEPSSRESDTTV